MNLFKRLKNLWKWSAIAPKLRDIVDDGTIFATYDEIQQGTYSGLKPKQKLATIIKRSNPLDVFDTEEDI